MKGSSLKFNVHSPGGRNRQRGRQTDRQLPDRYLLTAQLQVLLLPSSVPACMLQWPPFANR